MKKSYRAASPPKKPPDQNRITCSVILAYKRLKKYLSVNMQNQTWKKKKTITLPHCASVEPTRRLRQNIIVIASPLTRRRKSSP